MFHSYRNQLTAFHGKPTDWFLNEWNIGLKWVKVQVTFSLTLSTALYLEKINDWIVLFKIFFHIPFGMFKLIKYTVYNHSIKGNYFRVLYSVLIHENIRRES